MEATEKEKQILNQTAAFEKGELTPEEEVEIFFPEPQKVIVGGKEYELKPLTLGQMKALLRLASIDLKKVSMEMLDGLIDGIAELIGEPDKLFLEKHLSMPVIKNIFLKIRASTYLGIPKDKGAPSRQ